MNLYNDGKAYEEFVKKLQQALIDSESFLKQKNIKIEKNKKILDRCNIEREFDLYWEYELAGVIYKTIIECRDYSSTIAIDQIDALIGKMHDLPGLKPVFATTKGYQSGAKAKAEQHAIELLIVREQNDSDWQDKDGNRYLKEINFKLTILSPTVILRFLPNINGEWARKNSKLDTTKPLHFSGMNNRIFIEDCEKGKKYSLLDLQNELVSPAGVKFGTFQKEEKFTNAFIYYGDMKLKLNSYAVEYSIAEPRVISMKHDFTKELVGVIEYLQKGIKKTIFKNNIIKEVD